MVMVMIVVVVVVVVLSKEDFESVGPNQGLSQSFLAVHRSWEICNRTSSMTLDCAEPLVTFCHPAVAMAVAVKDAASLYLSHK